MNVGGKCLAILVLQNYKNEWAAGAAQRFGLDVRGKGNGVVG